MTLKNTYLELFVLVHINTFRKGTEKQHFVLFTNIYCFFFCKHEIMLMNLNTERVFLIFLVLFLINVVLI